MEKRGWMVRESKMYNMPFSMEREYNSKNSKKGLCLPQMRKNLEIKRVFQKIIILIFKLLVSALVTYPFAIGAIAYAHIERGYKAYGGEYLFIGMVFYIAFMVLGFSLKK